MPPEISVTVPGLLARFTDGERSVQLRASDVAECLDALVDEYPELGTHLSDDSGTRRPHVQVLYDGSVVERGEESGVGLEDGDEVVVLQAVSGG